MKSNYLVCYDISSPKRLAKVFRLIKGQGIHLQYSVFLCRLAWPQLKSLKSQIAGLINNKQDDVRIYPLPAKMKVDTIGRGYRIPEGVDVYLGGSSP